MSCSYDSTRTSPYGYYGCCSCGYVTHTFRADPRDAYDDVADHVAGRVPA